MKVALPRDPDQTAVVPTDSLQDGLGEAAWWPLQALEKESVIITSSFLGTEVESMAIILGRRCGCGQRGM